MHACIFSAFGSLYTTYKHVVRKRGEGLIIPPSTADLPCLSFSLWSCPRGRFCISAQTGAQVHAPLSTSLVAYRTHLLVFAFFLNAYFGKSFTLMCMVLLWNVLLKVILSPHVCIPSTDALSFSPCLHQHSVSVLLLAYPPQMGTRAHAGPANARVKTQACW